MEISVYPKDFSKTFSNLLEKANITCYQIHQYTHIDQAYLSRLRSGKMKNPSREVVLLISYAFTHYNKDIRLRDLGDLFKSTGYSFYIKN